MCARARVDQSWGGERGIIKRGDRRPDSVVLPVVEHLKRRCARAARQSRGLCSSRRGREEGGRRGGGGEGFSRCFSSAASRGRGLQGEVGGGEGGVFEKSPRGCGTCASFQLLFSTTPTHTNTHTHVHPHAHTRTHSKREAAGETGVCVYKSYYTTPNTVDVCVCVCVCSAIEAHGLGLKHPFTLSNFPPPLPPIPT